MLSVPPFVSMSMASKDVMVYLVSGALFAVGAAMIVMSVT
jgi:hypothetical protein